MGINNFNLQQLHTALSKALSETDAKITAKYASRTFKLVDPTSQKMIEVKLKDIVDQYKTLASTASTPNDSKLISEINHQITTLDLIGDALLAQRGPGSRFFRDIGNVWKNSFGEGTHLEIIDKVEADHFKNQVGNNALQQEMSNVFSRKEDVEKIDSFSPVLNQLYESLKASRSDESAKAELTHTLRMFSSSHPKETYQLIAKCLDTKNRISPHKPELHDEDIAFLESFKLRLEARTGSLREVYIQKFKAYTPMKQEVLKSQLPGSEEDQLLKSSSPAEEKTEVKTPEKAEPASPPSNPKAEIPKEDLPLSPPITQPDTPKDRAPRVDKPSLPDIPKDPATKPDLQPLPLKPDLSLTPPITPISSTKTEPLSSSQLTEICDYLNSSKITGRPEFVIEGKQIVAKINVFSGDHWEKKIQIAQILDEILKGLEDKGKLISINQGNDEYLQFTISDPINLEKLYKEVVEAKSKPIEPASESIKPPEKSINPADAKAASPQAPAVDQAHLSNLQPKPLDIVKGYEDKWFVTGNKSFKERKELLKEIVGNKDLSNDQVSILFERFKIKKDGGFFFYENFASNDLHRKIQNERSRVYKNLPITYSKEKLLKNEAKVEGAIHVLTEGENFIGCRIVFNDAAAKKQYLEKNNPGHPDLKTDSGSTTLDLDEQAFYRLLGANSKLSDHVDLVWDYINSLSEKKRVIDLFQTMAPESHEVKMAEVKSENRNESPLASALLSNNIAEFKELVRQGEMRCAVIEDGKITDYSIDAFLLYQTKIELIPGFKNEELLAGSAADFHPERSVGLKVKKFLNHLDPQFANLKFFPGIKVDKDHIEINFAEEDRQLGRMLAANLTQYEMYGFQFWDDKACSFKFEGKDAEIFLRTCCNFPPKWVELTFSSEYGFWDQTFRTKMNETIQSYGPNYDVVLSPIKNPQLKFSYDSEMERNEYLEKIKRTLTDYVDHPVGKGFQLPEKNNEGKYDLILTANESYHLMGFGFLRVEDPLFKQFLGQIFVEKAINNTPKISQNYTSEAGIEDQRKAHSEAKEFLTQNLNLIGSSIEFISTTKPGSEVLEIKRDLNPNVFSWEITNGVGEDIQKAGLREDDTHVIFSAASQYNGSEAMDKYTLTPGEACVAYAKDGTQGPKAQLAFSRNQVEIINCGGNNKYNGLSNVLTEETKSAVTHGYLTPDNSNAEKVIKNLRDNGDKLEFPIVTSIPKEGVKPVSIILVAAPAFGQYSSWDNPIMDKEKEQEIQYLCALQGFKAQFKSAIDASQGGTRKVELKATPVGLGVFKNDPQMVAKAFYNAGKEYESQLLNSNVTVQLQVYKALPRKHSENPDQKVRDYFADMSHKAMLKSPAYQMAGALFNQE